jgi:hypothetical protein
VHCKIPNAACRSELARQPCRTKIITAWNQSSHEKHDENCDTLTFLSFSWQRCKLNFQYFFVFFVKSQYQSPFPLSLESWHLLKVDRVFISLMFKSVNLSILQKTINKTSKFPHAVANAFTIRNMYSLLLYMNCNSRKINRPTKNMTKIVTLLHF